MCGTGRPPRRATRSCGPSSAHTARHLVTGSGCVPAQLLPRALHLLARQPPHCSPGLCCRAARQRLQTPPCPLPQHTVYSVLMAAVLAATSACARRAQRPVQGFRTLVHGVRHVDGGGVGGQQRVRARRVQRQVQVLVLQRVLQRA